MTQILLWTGLKIGVALLILSILDYGFQRWKHERDLRMTPQEMREEMKNLEGNPQMIARRRQVQRQLAMHRLSDAVPKADVVITNPTELAVAIQYVPATMAAPIVVAKGAGVLAQRIRRLAVQSGIPIVEQKPLARALYQTRGNQSPDPAGQICRGGRSIGLRLSAQGEEGSRRGLRQAAAPVSGKGTATHNILGDDRVSGLCWRLTTVNRLLAVQRILVPSMRSFRRPHETRHPPAVPPCWQWAS